MGRKRFLEKNEITIMLWSIAIISARFDIPILTQRYYFTDQQSIAFFVLQKRQKLWRNRKDRRKVN